MPLYEHACSACGTMELYRPMSEAAPTRCPHCGRAGLERIYSAHFIGAVDANQESENGGFGKFYPQAGKQFLDPKTKKHRNPAAHARSRYEMIEKLKRRGAEVEKT